MFIVNIASINIKILNKYPYIEKICSKYIINADNFAFTVSVTDDEISAEKTDPESKIGLPYFESIAIFRKIALKILEYNVFLMHGVLLETGDRGLLLCARSGVGKTTHAKNLVKYLGEENARIINGDKPWILVENGIPYGFGSPWCGKEGISVNKRIKVTDVCFIERAKENSVEKLPSEQIFVRIMNQVWYPNLMKYNRMLLFDLLEDMITKVNFYLIKCNTDLDSARVTCDAIIKRI